MNCYFDFSKILITNFFKNNLLPILQFHRRNKLSNKNMQMSCTVIDAFYHHLYQNSCRFLNNLNSKKEGVSLILFSLRIRTDFLIACDVHLYFFKFSYLNVICLHIHFCFEFNTVFAFVY